MSYGNHALALVAAALLLLLGAAEAQAGPIVATYEAAGVETPQSASICGSTPGCTVGYETFNSITQTQAATGYISNFSSGTGVATPYTGQYTAFDLYSAGEYGGAGGVGLYPEVFGYTTPPSYSLTLTNNNTGGGVNYFGVWISALDPGNQMQFFDANGNLIYTFTAAQLIADLGNCSGGHAANAYCGNPTYYNNDAGELFAYVNFFDTAGTFSKITFSEALGTGAGFETDNQAVAYNSNISVSSGTAVVPEPGSLSLMSASFICFVLVRRRIARPIRRPHPRQD